MNNSNSDWLNDTLPENINDNVNNTLEGNVNNNESTITEDNNNIIAENNVDNSSNIQIENNDINENSIEKENIKKEIPTLGGLVDKINEEEQTDDEKYLIEYIGPNADKFTYKIISIPGFFFSSLYMLYRKLYLLGFITLLIQFSIIIFVNPFVALVINVLVGLFFNSIYISHYKRKIERIRNLSGSKEFANIINLCSQKGGVNKGAAFFGFILEIAIFVFAIYQFPDNKYFSPLSNLLNETIEEIKLQID